MKTFKQYILETTKKDILAGLDKVSADRSPKGKTVYATMLIDVKNGNIQDTSDVQNNPLISKLLNPKAKYLYKDTFYIPGTEFQPEKQKRFFGGYIIELGEPIIRLYVTDKKIADMFKILYSYTVPDHENVRTEALKYIGKVEDAWRGRPKHSD